MNIDAAMTLELVTEYGADAVFRVYPSKVYDPETGKATLGAPTNHTHKVVEGQASEAFARIDGVPEADLILYVSPSGMTITPEVGMEVLYDSKTWVIFAHHRTAYKGSAVLYELALNSK